MLRDSRAYTWRHSVRTFTPRPRANADGRLRHPAGPPHAGRSAARTERVCLRSARPGLATGRRAAAADAGSRAAGAGPATPIDAGRAYRVRGRRRGQSARAARGRIARPCGRAYAAGIRRQCGSRGALLLAQSFCVISGVHHRSPAAGNFPGPSYTPPIGCRRRPTPHCTPISSEAFLRHGLTPPQPLYQSASFYSCVTILQNSDCLMMVPHEVGRHFANQSGICILSVKVGEASAPFSLIKRRSRAETRGVLAFETAVRRALRDIR